MADDEYLALLDRAKSSLPEKIEKHERFSIPDPDILQEGKITVIRNFLDITDALRRDPQHLLQFLLREMGAPGSLEGRRAVLKAKLNANQVSERIANYTETFVICSECKLPDTRMTKEGRILVLECDACGAHRPVHVRKAIKPESPDAIKEGEVYDLLIHDVGRKGDGVARQGDVMIVVPGTVKGSQVRVRITKVAGKTAFGVLTQDPATR